MTLPSLELNWLRNLDKTLLLPKVVFFPSERLVINSDVYPCSGLYLHPFEWEVRINGEFHDGQRGIILASTQNPELTPAAIAHEWRHHWQFCNGLLPAKPGGWSEADGRPENYASAIKKYFRTQWHEFDALQYELSKYRTWSNEHMADLVFSKGK